MHAPLLRLALYAMLASPVAAETFVVDRNNGPGTDFTDLPTAVAAVHGGDILLLRSGNYHGFSTSKGISILGQGWPNIAYVDIGNLMVNASFALRGAVADAIAMYDCAGTVFLEKIESSGVTITDCEDVRMADMGIWGSSEALLVGGVSQVEVVRSFIVGADGGDAWDSFDGEDGSDAVIVGTGSKVQIALSSIFGGLGGDGYQGGGHGGDGGDGIVVNAGAELILSGRANNVIVGGSGGWGYHYGHNGLGGMGLMNAGSTRYSGVTIHGIVNNGYTEQPPTDDPLLVVAMHPGVIHVEVHGAPGGNARLMLGREPRLPFGGFLVKPLMLEPISTLWLGLIDSTGTISKDFTWSFASNYSDIGYFLLQASVVVGGETVRTNSGFVLSK